jgi:hypothetical protein
MDSLSGFADLLSGQHDTASQSPPLPSIVQHSIKDARECEEALMLDAAGRHCWQAAISALSSTSSSDAVNSQLGICYLGLAKCSQQDGAVGKAILFLSGASGNSKDLGKAVTMHAEACERKGSFAEASVYFGIALLATCGDEDGNVKLFGSEMERGKLQKNKSGKARTKLMAEVIFFCY